MCNRLRANIPLQSRDRQALEGGTVQDLPSTTSTPPAKMKHMREEWAATARHGGEEWRIGMDVTLVHPPDPITAHASAKGSFLCVTRTVLRWNHCGFRFAISVWPEEHPFLAALGQPQARGYILFRTPYRYSAGTIFWPLRTVALEIRSYHQAFTFEIPRCQVSKKGGLSYLCRSYPPNVKQQRTRHSRFYLYVVSISSVSLAVSCA